MFPPSRSARPASFSLLRKFQKTLYDPLLLSQHLFFLLEPYLIPRIPDPHPLILCSNLHSFLSSHRSHLSHEINVRSLFRPIGVSTPGSAAVTEQNMRSSLTVMVLHAPQGGAPGKADNPGSSDQDALDKRCFEDNCGVTKNRRGLDSERSLDGLTLPKSSSD